MESDHKVLHAYYVNTKDKSGLNIVEKMNHGWITLFMERHNLFQRKKTGELIVFTEKQLAINQEVAYNIYHVKQLFDSVDLYENLSEKIDETHFLVNMDNGITMTTKGINNVKCPDVVSYGKGMALVVIITGGTNEKIFLDMMRFKNKDRNYLICGMEDNIPGIYYHTKTKGLMDG